MTVDFIAELAAARVLAIIRGTDTAATVAAGKALLEEGVRLVEVSLTTPGAPRAIEAIRSDAPAGSLVGAGTVLTVSDVADVAAAGAQFIVTPAVVESIAEAARRGLPVAAGALTPTEAQAAVRHGASAVKLFPASLGGPAYLKSLRDPFPDIPFVAVGGVGLDEMHAYLAVGAVAVGVGGTLRMHIAGAESNVTIALARLGHRAAWAGRVGTDELGEFVLRQLRAEGVQVDGVTRDPERPPGLMFLEQRTADVTRVQYHRAGSTWPAACVAGSRSAPSPFPPAVTGKACRAATNWPSSTTTRPEAPSAEPSGASPQKGTS
jgi:2-dehydro-3-deoxyphosphogluconate aldolase/(4S)-4-hydroxy-2-oxoglutarate aldolase